MPEVAPSPQDRRHRRRQQTITEILDVAVAVMAEEGAGGLSLGEVARRIGVRTPSLYVYFDSKHAVYDAVFQRGWSRALEVVATHEQRMRQTDDPAGEMLAGACDFARWALAHPVYAQLMFWRPVPGFEPSAQAYAPAAEVLDKTTSALAVLRDAGVLRDDVEPADVVHAWTALVSGVISQQLSNAPDESFENGSFTRLLPQLVSMFFAYYGPVAEGRTDGGTAGSRTRPKPSGDRPSQGRRTGHRPARRDAGSGEATRRR
jgi:AcrR family transcriptional regulator